MSKSSNMKIMEFETLSFQKIIFLIWMERSTQLCVLLSHVRCGDINSGVRVERGWDSILCLGQISTPPTPPQAYPQGNRSKCFQSPGRICQWLIIFLAMRFVFILHVPSSHCSSILLTELWRYITVCAREMSPAASISNVAKVMIVSAQTATEILGWSHSHPLSCPWS